MTFVYRNDAKKKRKEKKKKEMMLNHQYHVALNFFPW